MPERLRSLVGRLREYAGDRRHAPRRRVRLPFSVWLQPTTGEANGRRAVPSLSGNTWDISATGLGLVVPAIRIGEHYLTGEDRRLRIILELPSGSVQLIATPVRYERIEEDGVDKGYVIGVHIIEIDPQDRERFRAFLGP